MKYYTETNYMDHDDLRTAGGKGRDDYFEVLRRCGLECIRIPTLRKSTSLSIADRLLLETRLRKVWKDNLSNLGEGDVLVLHSPVSEKFTGYSRVIKKVKKRGCRIVNIVFDLETFFMSDYRKAAYVKHAFDAKSEADLFRMSDVLIVHNEKMKEKICSLGIDPGKIVCVGVMDYLRDDEPKDVDKRFSPDGPVVFCGNLLRSKSGFAYVLGDDFKIDLYGPGFTGRTSEKVNYRGVFTSLELMDVITGSFGLVWDGTSVKTCTGACGEYLSYNNPHKMSHYLASGMPVLIWKGAALAEFVTAEGCGIAISSLDEIPGILQSVSPEEYDMLKNNAGRVGREMREGAHIRKAVLKALDMLRK